MSRFVFPAGRTVCWCVQGSRSVATRNPRLVWLDWACHRTCTPRSIAQGGVCNAARSGAGWPGCSSSLSETPLPWEQRSTLRGTFRSVARRGTHLVCGSLFARPTFPFVGRPLVRQIRWSDFHPFLPTSCTLAADGLPRDCRSGDVWDGFHAALVGWFFSYASPTGGPERIYLRSLFLSYPLPQLPLLLTCVVLPPIVRRAA